MTFLLKLLPLEFCGFFNFQFSSPYEGREMTFPFKVFYLDLYIQCQIWLGMLWSYPIRFQKLHLPQYRSKQKNKKKYISIIWHSLVFAIFPLLEEGLTLHFKRVVSPLPNDTLCEVLLKLAQLLLSRRFLMSWSDFYIIAIVSSDKKGNEGPLFEWNYTPFTRGCYVQNMLK